MTRRAIALLASLAMLCGVAAADVESDASTAFRAASQQTVADEHGAIVAFEKIGRSRPITRWTEHAWSEVARLAERAGDLARARTALDEVIAIGHDEQLVRRAQVTRARLQEATGSGAWDRVAAEHGRLLRAIGSGGDPEPALVQLEALVRGNPGYPRIFSMRRSLARGWEMEGDRNRAMMWLRDRADGDADQPLRIDLARMLVRDGALDEATTVIREALARPDADRAALSAVIGSIAEAERRGLVRVVLWILLGIAAVVAAGLLRSTTGSWRASARRIARPPIEALFLLPVALLIVVVAHTGNPLVAHAVRAIAIAGLAVTWISGALLEAARARGTVGFVRIACHAGLAVVTVAITAYLAVEREHVLDLLLETWRGGHALE